MAHEPGIPPPLASHSLRYNSYTGHLEAVASKTLDFLYRVPDHQLWGGLGDFGARFPF
jgi:hypothetical protein